METLHHFIIMKILFCIILVNDRLEKNISIITYFYSPFLFLHLTVINNVNTQLKEEKEKGSVYIEIINNLNISLIDENMVISSHYNGRFEEIVRRILYLINSTFFFAQKNRVDCVLYSFEKKNEGGSDSYADDNNDYDFRSSFTVYVDCAMQRSFKTNPKLIFPL